MTLNQVGLTYACAETVRRMQQDNPHVPPFSLWPEDRQMILRQQVETAITAYMQHEFATAH